MISQDSPLKRLADFRFTLRTCHLQTVININVLMTRIWCQADVPSLNGNRYFLFCLNNKRIEYLCCLKDVCSKHLPLVVASAHPITANIWFCPWLLFCISFDTIKTSYTTMLHDDLKLTHKTSAIPLWRTACIFRGCLHDTGTTFAPERVHSGSLWWLHICLNDTTTKCYAGASHPGVSSPRFLYRGENFTPVRNLAAVSCKRETTTRFGVKHWNG